LCGADSELYPVAPRLLAKRIGGELVVGDYSAKPGAGTSVVQTLHRSDEALARSEIEAAGFELIDHGDFLHVPRGCPRRPLAFRGPTGRYLRAEISQAGLTRKKRRPLRIQALTGSAWAYTASSGATGTAEHHLRSSRT
jgi:hypothetical protein